MTAPENTWREVQGQRERFMRDPVPVRLGNLASTLARLATCATRPAQYSLLDRLLLEAEYFIDCSGPEADPAIQAELVTLQVDLARWRLRWQAAPTVEAASQIAARGRDYSRKVLEWSGLLK